MSFQNQSDELWRLREQLDAEVSTSALVGLLEFNSQMVPTGRAALLDAVSDAMLFGALPHCPLDSAPLICVDGGYRCSRLADHWAPCLFSATATDAASLARGPFRVPSEYHDVSFLCVLNVFYQFTTPEFMSRVWRTSARSFSSQCFH